MRCALQEHSRDAASRVSTWIYRFVVIFVTCACSARSFAQGCAACYTTAASGGPQTAHALRSGILVLLFPPLLIFGGIILAIRNWKTMNPGRERECPVSVREPHRS